jgi:outer membrane beta-barrel protein
MRCARRRSLGLVTLAALCCPVQAGAQHEEEVAPLVDQLWARQTAVVQPRLFAKAGGVELVGLVGVIPNDPFVVYVPLGLRVAYHLTEQWALEASFAYNLQADTELRQYLEENDAQLRARIRDRQQLRAGASLVWSPIYGKLAVGGAVVHLDAHLLAGAGIVRTEEEPSVDLAAATRPDFHLGLGLRVFLARRWLLRLELRQYAFLRPTDRAGGGGGVGFPSEISLAAGVLLGGGR